MDTQKLGKICFCQGWTIAKILLLQFFSFFDFADCERIWRKLKHVHTEIVCMCTYIICQLEVTVLWLTERQCLVVNWKTLLCVPRVPQASFHFITPHKNLWLLFNLILLQIKLYTTSAPMKSKKKIKIHQM